MKPSSNAFWNRPALAVAFALVLLAGCEDRSSADLSQVLASTEGQIEDEGGRTSRLEDLLAAARGRPVSVSFAYVGCGGGEPRLARLNEAAKAIPDSRDMLHIVLNIVDEPSRFPDLARDLAGDDREALDPNAVRVAFLRKPELFPKINGEAVDGVMQAMGLRFGSQTHIETVTGIGIFDRTGRFVGIRY